MSEQQAEQTKGEAGSVTAAPIGHPSADPLIEKALASVQEVRNEAPEIAPDHETLPKEDPPKLETARPEPPSIEANTEGRAEIPKFDAAKFPQPKVGPIRVGLSKAEQKADSKADYKADPRGGAGRAAAAKVMIMAPADPAAHRNADPPRLDPDPVAAAPRQRRFGATAAVAVLALAAGAIGGALAAGLTHQTAPAAVAEDASSLNASIARIDAEILSLKAGLERTGRQETSQFNKTNDRLDKIEKAQAEPATRLARLSDAVDKLRGASASASAPAAGLIPAAAKETTKEAAGSAPALREITGSVPAASNAAATPQQAAAAATSAKGDKGDKTDFARLPKVEGWVLRDVSHGGALIEGRQGLYEVYAGDPVPGLGRVDAIRKQDGRWVVVTTKGLVVAR